MTGFPAGVNTAARVILLKHEPELVSPLVKPSNPFRGNSKIPSLAYQASHVLTLSTSLSSFHISPSLSSAATVAMFLQLVQHPPTLEIYLSGSSAWVKLLPDIYGAILYPLSDYSATSSEKPSLTVRYKRASLTVIRFFVLCSSCQNLIYYLFMCLCIYFLSPMTRNKLHKEE